jgi:sugar lactone lactonase YvrE
MHWKIPHIGVWPLLATLACGTFDSRSHSGEESGGATSSDGTGGTSESTSGGSAGLSASTGGRATGGESEASGGTSSSSGGSAVASGGTTAAGGTTTASGGARVGDAGDGRPTKLPPGAPPPAGHTKYFGTKPAAGAPAPIGNTRIFDDIAGLVWNRTRNELLFVVSQNNEIMRYREGLADAQNFDVMRPGGEHMDDMKGLDLGPDGALWVCEARYSLPPRVSRSEGAYDRPVTVVDHFQEPSGSEPVNFTSPWYVSVRWDDNVYFTDTPHRYSGAPNKHLFRIDPAGKLTLLKEYATDEDLSEGGPYGIALAPDQRSFYISTWNHPGHPQLVRFDLADGGAVAKETLVTTDEDGPIQSVDGLCIDQGENLYLCTGGGGVRMYAPDGHFLGSIDVPGATDCTFGGADMKTLFVATSGGVAGDKNLYRIPMNVPGLP